MLYKQISWTDPNKLFTRLQGAGGRGEKRGKANLLNVAQRLDKGWRKLKWAHLVFPNKQSQCILHLHAHVPLERPSHSPNGLRIRFMVTDVHCVKWNIRCTKGKYKHIHQYLFGRTFSILRAAKWQRRVGKSSHLYLWLWYEFSQENNFSDQS